MCIYIPYHIISMKKTYSMTECEFVYCQFLYLFVFFLFIAISFF